jgi:hypothetical protein
MTAGEEDVTMYKICWSDGREQVVGTYEDAVAEVDAAGCLVIGHDGDLGEGGDRTLCWWTEEDAANDDGQRAAASIREVQS